jgi:membrane protein DedA with SNARE-associated domain
MSFWMTFVLMISGALIAGVPAFWFGFFLGQKYPNAQ